MRGELLLKQAAAESEALNRLIDKFSQKPGLFRRFLHFGVNHPIVALGGGLGTYGVGKLGVNEYRDYKQRKAIYGLQ